MPGRAFLHAAFGTTLLSAESVIVDVNEEFCRMLGYDAEELVGRHLLEVVHPDDHGLIDRIHGAMRRGEIDSDQTHRRYVRKDGDVLHAMAGVTAVRDDAGTLVGIVKQIQDISRRVRAERELQESLARQRVVIDALADGLLVFDADGRIRVSNPSAEEILGASGPELRAGPEGPQMRLFDEAGEPVPREAYIDVQVLRTGRPLHGVIYRVERPDGRSRWVRANAQPLLGAGGEESYAVVSFADVTALKAREHELVHNALHDPLTDLPNRRYLVEHLGRLLGDERRKGGGHAVLYIDLDGFERVNDRYGHNAGDRLLVQVARRMMGALEPGQVLARLAGDEFAALLTSVGSSERAAEVAQALVDAVGEPFELDGITVVIGALVGMTMAQPEDEAPTAVLDRADASLRRVREMGTSLPVAFSPAVDPEVRRLARLAGDLPGAHTRGELTLGYRPVLSLAGGRPAGEKAVVRWEHPRLGAVPAALVRRLIRASDVATELRAWAVHEALARFGRRAGDGGDRVFLSVTPELLLDGGRERIREMLAETDVEPARLVLAVDAADDAEDEHLTEVAEAVAGLGIELMLESSGEGRTRSRRAAEFPYRWVGVHPARIGRSLADDAGRAALRGVLEGLREAGIKTVAETDGRAAHDVAALQALGFEYRVGAPTELGSPGDPEGRPDGAG